MGDLRDDVVLDCVADALIADESAPFIWRLAAVLHRRGSDHGSALLKRIVEGWKGPANGAVF